MNKFLLASTALVASTTFAMADVDLSGSAEMGIFGGETADGDDIDTQFHTDIDVTFSMSGETDAGLTFGASIDLDEQIGDNNAIEGGDAAESGATQDDADDGGATIFVSGNLGTLTMGDTDGAFDFALTEAIIGSSLRDNHEHAGYNGNAGLDGTYDGQVARYDYSFGDFGVAVSAEIDDDADSDDGMDLFDDFGATIDDIEDDTVLGIGATYNGDFGGFSFGAGLGYQQTGDSSLVGMSLSTEIAGIQAILNYTSYDDVPLAVGSIFRPSGDADDPATDVDESLESAANNTELDNHIGIALGYSFGELLVAANYGVYDTDQGDVSGYGLIANYDLGGGASLQAGYGHSDFDDIAGEQDFDTYSFGIAMSF